VLLSHYIRIIFGRFDEFGVLGNGKEEVREMRKTMLMLTVVLAAAALVGGFYMPATAAVEGPCVNCHTMHNSQGGVAMVFGDGVTMTQGALTRSTCLGCHTTTGSDPFDGVYPYVKLGGTATNYLAGGYFTDDGGNHDDASHTLASPETPAGYDDTEIGAWYTGDVGGSGGLTCAGSAGCHGTEDTADEAEAISGGHHETNLSLGYRLLGVDGEKVLGGGTGGDNDYEEALNDSPSIDDYHNLYSANQAALDEASISELCGKCHGDFHGTDDTTNVDGAWIRHPTDVVLPSDWEIPTSVSGDYDFEDWKYNPVGTVDADVPADGTDVYVTCISCHRAHGSEYDDILRFDYGDQQAGSITEIGCLGCHDKQRGS
jgi:predicted CXXCH cytochrome family protein